jgi:hypothetical protein
MIEATRKETIVRQRYVAGAKERADKLCCPVDSSTPLGMTPIVPPAVNRFAQTLREQFNLAATWAA